MSQNIETTPQGLPMMPMPMFYPPTAYPMMTNPFFMMPPTMDPSAMKAPEFAASPDAAHAQMLPAVPSAIRAGDRPVGTAASILSGSAPTLSSLPPMASALAPMPFAYPYGYYFNPAMHAPGMMPMMPPTQLMPTPPPSGALPHSPGQMHVSPTTKRTSSFSNWHGSSRVRSSASNSPSSPRTHSPTNSVHSSHDTEFSAPQSPTAALLSLASAASSARSTVHSAGSKRSRHLAGGSRGSSPDASHFVAVKTSKDASGSKIRTHQCSVCLKHFTRRSNLVAHIRIHTGDKPYQCTHPGCGKRFCQSSNLKRHTRIHYTTAKVDSNTSIHVWPLAGTPAGTPPAVPSPTSSTGSVETKPSAPVPAGVAAPAAAEAPVAAAAPAKKE